MLGAGRNVVKDDNFCNHVAKLCNMPSKLDIFLDNLPRFTGLEPRENEGHGAVSLVCRIRMSKTGAASTKRRGTSRTACPS